MGEASLDHPHLANSARVSPAEAGSAQLPAAQGGDLQTLEVRKRWLF